MRRVITGHKDGKSVVVDDAEVLTLGRFGRLLFPIWKAETVPSIPLKKTDFNVDVNFVNFKLGEVYTGTTILPPDEKYISDAKASGVDAVEDWYKLWGDDFNMHTTDTVDINIIVSGEIWMELDDGKEVHLKVGDCVVQNGTRHAWNNRSNEDCIIFTAMIRAQRDS
jgi:mannose-6-phosphate isomerase-like protein (cupin superfamily)